MLSKLLSTIFKETTNTATRETVTFNTTGTYDPKFGKKVVYVSGKGQNGTTGTAYYSYVSGNAATYNTSPGTAYYNYIAGTAVYNTVTNIASYNYSPGGNQFSVYWKQQSYNYTTLVANYAYGNNATIPNSYTYNASGIITSHNYSAVTTYYNSTNYPAVYNPPTYPSAGYNAPSYPYAGTYATSYPASTYNPPSYPYAGTNPPTTGASASAFGITFPGGVGGAATAVAAAAVITNYGAASTVTVPSGAYITVSARINDSDPV
jgi:hypothetical protein